MYKNVLVAIDGSPAGEAALLEAVDVARRDGARVTALCVLDLYTAIGDMQMASESLFERHVEDMRARGREIVASASAAAGGIDLRPILLESRAASVADAIVAEAANGYDLLVIGTHGRSGWRKWALGSVAQRVAHLARIPVLMVRASATATAHAGNAAPAQDIFTEPTGFSQDTLANLGPLRAMAGVWLGEHGTDVSPVRGGANRQEYVERIELQPIDPQLNGPQLLYGLRYHSHVVKPGEVATYHEQVGYWLWEPATGTVMHTLTIPRGETVLAAGRASAAATQFELSSKHGSATYGICSNAFLDRAFTTLEFSIRVTVARDGTWSYDEDTVLAIAGSAETFHHTDRNTLRKVAEPTPNPLMRKPSAETAGPADATPRERMDSRPLHDVRIAIDQTQSD